MKKYGRSFCSIVVTRATLLLSGIVLITGCGWTRIGSLTMISTRNIESKVEYKLIAKDVEGVSKLKERDAFQEAVDEAVRQYPEGELMKNVVVSIKDNGKKIKVKGDVWGVPSVEKNVTQKVTAEINFEMGDRVAFKNDRGKIVEGTIKGINANQAMVEFINPWNNKLKSDMFTFDKLTKLQSAQSQPPAVVNNNSQTTLKPVEPPIGNNTTQKDMYKVTSDALNIREKPNSASDLILKINKGSEVELIEKTNANWWKVKYSGVVGYVSSKFLSK